MEARMFALALILLAVVLLSAGIGVLLFRVIPERWGGPVPWGRRLAWRFGSLGAFALIAVIGSAVTFLVMMPVGLLAKSLQGSVDVPVLHWTIATDDPASVFTKFNHYVTILGDRATTDVVCLTAALILAFAYRRRWWIPLVAIGVTFAVQNEGQRLLAAWLGRDLPPVMLAGAFPSGGVSRMLADYGVIIVLIVLLFAAGNHPLSRGWRMGLAIGLGLFAAVEGFTRFYLALHWLTDIGAGFVFGWLLFFTFATATAALETPTALFRRRAAAPALVRERPVARV
jgi:hypothetical protein